MQKLAMRYFKVVLCITQFWKTIILCSVIYFKELSVDGIARIAWRKSGSNALRVSCILSGICGLTEILYSLTLKNIPGTKPYTKLSK